MKSFPAIGLGQSPRGAFGNANFEFHSRFINLSAVVLDDDDVDVLNLGFKFNFHKNLSSNDLALLAIEAERILETFGGLSNTDLIRTNVASTINQYLKTKNNHNNYTMDRKLKKLTNKVKDNNLVITKADKSNCIVILDRVDYVDRVESFLRDGFNFISSTIVSSTYY